MGLVVADHRCAPDPDVQASRHRRPGGGRSSWEAAVGAVWSRGCRARNLEMQAERCVDEGNLSWNPESLRRGLQLAPRAAAEPSGAWSRGPGPNGRVRKMAATQRGCGYEIYAALIGRRADGLMVGLMRIRVRAREMRIRSLSPLANHRPPVPGRPRERRRKKQPSGSSCPFAPPPSIHACMGSLCIPTLELGDASCPQPHSSSSSLPKIALKTASPAFSASSASLRSTST